MCHWRDERFSGAREAGSLQPGDSRDGMRQRQLVEPPRGHLVDGHRGKTTISKTATGSLAAFSILVHGAARSAEASIKSHGMRGVARFGAAAAIQSNHVAETDRQSDERRSSLSDAPGEEQRCFGALTGQTKLNVLKTKLPLRVPLVARSNDPSELSQVSRMRIFKSNTCV